MQIAELITTYGLATGIIIYFLYKDYKFNETIIQLLREVKDVMCEIKTLYAIVQQKLLEDLEE